MIFLDFGKRTLENIGAVDGKASAPRTTDKVAEVTQQERMSGSIRENAIKVFPQDKIFGEVIPQGVEAVRVDPSGTNFRDERLSSTKVSKSSKLICRHASRRGFAER